LNGKASAPPAVPVSATVDADMETRIRKAYATIARRPGARVSLAQLREVLGAADRAEVDNALRQLSRSRDVDIFPDANQKVMTAEERAAALSIGNRDVHIISIGS
ncbi:MAG: hypothetical protein J2P15_10100, partial [Micromonosporaceae bacterium]|nr:hypothetical protein [Micromonosporaceae bacterium]